MSGWPHPRRLYAPSLPDDGGELQLPDESVQHARVLRLRTSVDVELFDARGATARASLVALDAKRAVCHAEPPRTQPRPRPGLHLIVGLPKGDKLDQVVRMLTELGAESLHIAVTERTVPRPADAQSRMLRLERIARQACAQSGQPFAPELHAPADLASIAARVPAGETRWLLWEESKAPRPFEPTPATQPMWVVVGPEGGLSEQEAALLRGWGFSELSLGSAILRFDTAVVTAAALSLHRMGRLR